MKRNHAAFTLCLLLAPMPVLGQDESPDERPGLIRRSIRHFLKDDETGDGRGVHWGPFAPRVAVPSSGGGPGPVLHFWAPNIGETSFDIHAAATYSIYKYRYYDLELGLVPHVDERLPRIETGTNALFPLSDLEKTASAPGFNIYAVGRYRDFPREDFYGVGPGSVKADHADYRLRDGLNEGVIRFRVSHLSVMGRAGILRTSILPGDDPVDPNVEAAYNEQTAPGLLRAPDFNHFSAGAWLELRDEPGNPHRGATFGVAYSRFDDRNGDAFAFRRLTLDAREFLKLGSNRSVLALRQTASLDSPDTGAAVPFYLRSTLGGGSFLRAYPSFRFRDDRLIYLASEYRLEVHPKVELALLYEGGKVFPRTDGFSLRELRYSYGAGLRLKSPRKVHVRLDVLHGQEGTRVHVKLGPSF